MARGSANPASPPPTSVQAGLFARHGLLHARTRAPGVLFVGVMLTLSLQRLAILLGLHDRYAAVPLGEVARSFIVGLRFDAVIACMAIVPLLAVFALSMPRLIEHRWFRRLVAGYGGLVIALGILLCIADYYFYEEFGSRLNHNAIHYLGYDYIWKTIFAQYPVGWAAVATIAVFMAGGWAMLKWGFDDRYNVGPVWHAVAWPTITTALVVLGIRGSLGPKALNTAPAYFSDNPAVTQLALNGMFTLREAITDTLDKNVKLADIYDPLLAEQARRLAIGQILRSNDQSLSDPDNPLRRVTETGRERRDYNVVLVVMESMSWHYIGALGGEPDYTPNLNQLAAQGILMERCFSVGGRTTRGVCGIVSGFPDLPGDSVTTRQAGHSNFFTLANVLRERGYETMFIYGGQPYYDHRQAYLGGNGVDRFIFNDQFSSQTFRTHLGWCDGDLFTTAHQTLSATGDRPFFAMMLTLAFHRDYKVPQGVVPPLPEARGHEHEDQINAVRYTDWAIGRFMEQARQAPYFDDTIFVFVADHSGGFLSNEPSPTSYRVPFLIYAPSIVGEQGRRVSATCSQMDVAPTILSLLGGRFTHTFFGSNVLDRTEGEGLAIIQTSDDSLVLIDGEGLVSSTPPHGAEARLGRFEAPDRLEPLSVDDPENQARSRAMSARARALLQVADELFRGGWYNLGEVRRPRLEAAGGRVMPRKVSHRVVQTYNDPS